MSFVQVCAVLGVFALVPIAHWLQVKFPTPTPTRRRPARPATVRPQPAAVALPTSPRRAYQQGYLRQASIEAEAAGRRAAREDFRSS